MAISVAALVISYFPDAGLADRLNSLLEQFGRVALVDNGSTDECLSAIQPLVDGSKVSLLRNQDNLGIATALNQGIRLLGGEGFEWVVTFDQDSLIQPGFLAAQLATLASQEHPENVAMIGANRIEPGSEIRHRWLRPSKIPPLFRRVQCGQAAQGVTLVITSGTMTSVGVFNELGGFRDELFIDLVDSEYCLRAHERKFVILVSCDARLSHKVGALTRHRVMGVRLAATHHNPLRRYYLFRNCVQLIRWHGLRCPHWLTYQILSLGEVFFGIALFETDKIRRLRACLIGLRDGLAGISGPLSSGRV